MVHTVYSDMLKTISIEAIYHIFDQITKIQIQIFRNIYGKEH